MWQVAPGQTLRQHSWDEETVLYNDLTGDTHLLDADTVAVLHALRAGPCDLPALCLALAAEPDAIPALEAILGDLVNIDLVEACPC